MKKKYIIIYIILVVLLMITTVSNIMLSNRKNTNLKESYSSDKQVFYDCDNKSYSTSYKKLSLCKIISIDCKDCKLVEGYYNENYFLYYKDDNLFVYDINNQKLLNTLKFDNKTNKVPTVKALTKKYKDFGFIYNISGNGSFYENANIIYSFEENKSYELNSSILCDGINCENYNISNDEIVSLKNFDNLLYGLYDLKNEKFILKQDFNYADYQEYVKYDYETDGGELLESNEFYIFGNNNKVEYIYDANKKLIYNGQDIKLDLFKVSIINNNYFVAFDGESTISIYEFSGNKLINSTIDLNEYKEEILSQLENQDMINDFIDSMKEKEFFIENISISANDGENENIININIDYYDNELYNEGFYLRFEYDINNKNLKQIEILYNGEE